METVDFLKTMSVSLDDMRTASEFVDIVLVFGKVRLPCHKVVLASNCEYFKRMFLAGMKESQTDEVVMNGIDCKTGVLIVKYLYSGSITVTEENAQDLLSASNMFLLSDLKDSIEKFLSKRIQPPNCVSLLNLSHFFELQDLIKTSRKFIADKWDDLSDESIVELTEDDMEVILKEHECQENNFLRLQSWVKSVDGGEERFPRLLENVKLSSCQKSFVHDIVMNQKLMVNTKGMKLIERALDDISTRETRTRLTFHFTVEGVSRLNEYSTATSSEYCMHNLWWHIFAMKAINFSGEMWDMVVGIRCRSRSDSTTWSCKANCQLRLLSHELCGEAFTKKMQHVFCAQTDCWGITPFISGSTLTDKQNGFVKNDCIVLEANIVADIPIGEL